MKGKGYNNGLSNDSIVIFLEKYGRSPDDISTFISSLLAYKGLEVYYLSLADRLLATRHTKVGWVGATALITYFLSIKFSQNVGFVRAAIPLSIVIASLASFPLFRAKLDLYGLLGVILILLRSVFLAEVV